MIDQETYTLSTLPGGSLTLDNGVAFYCSDEAQKHFVACADSANKAGQGWAITVSSGTVYVDTLYWEGAMNSEDAPAGVGAINIRPFDYNGSATAVKNWTLY